MLDSLENLDYQLVPDKALDNAETRRMILDLVDALPPEQRMTVLFYYYDEMSVRQIAQAMETSEGTVKSRLNYARKAIKNGVEDYERKGIKLYSASPLLLLVCFLRQEAAHTVLDGAAAAAIAGQVMAQAGGAGAGALSGAGASAAGAAGTGTGAAASGAAGSAVSAKLVAGLVAGAVALGGAGLGIAALTRGQAPHQSVPPAPTAVLAAPSAQAAPTPTPAPTPAPTPTPAADYGMAYAAYQAALDSRRAQIDAYVGWYESFGQTVRPVAVADVFGDDTPELICVEADEVYPESVSYLTVLTWQDGQVVSLLRESWDFFAGSMLSYTLYQGADGKTLYADTSYFTSQTVIEQFCLEERGGALTLRQVETLPAVKRVILSNETDAPQAMTSAEAAAFLAGGGDG